MPLDVLKTAWDHNTNFATYLRGHLVKKIALALLILFLVICGILLSMVRFDIPVEELKGKFAPPPSHFLNLNGLLVHYRDEGKGFPVVLIHGTSSSLHTWDEWTKELVKRYRVVRMDIPAFGLTGPSHDRDYTPEAYVKFLEAFLHTLNIQKCHLAGNSLGGLIAWNYAVSFPHKVDKLVLIDAAGYPFRKMPTLFRLTKFAPFAFLGKYVTPRFLITKNLREVYGDDSKITDELIERYYLLALREGNRQAFIDRVHAHRDSDDDAARIKKIERPTLILWGKDDRWIPLEYGIRFNEDIPGSKLIVYEGVGHVPMEEIPEKTVKDAMEFFSKK